MGKKPTITPMMAQWSSCKEKSKGALLLFRMGDFYEAFHEDAATLAKELELTLTKRQEIPMSGIPYHTIESYLDRLVERGYRVAIAEQTEDPRQAKGLVKREVVRIISPGTLVSSSLLTEKSNNFFAVITSLKNKYGFAFIDLTTAEFKTIEFDNNHTMLNELHRLRPSEILTSKKIYDNEIDIFEELRICYKPLMSIKDNPFFDQDEALHILKNHLSVHTLDSYGLIDCHAAITASGTLIRYLTEELCLNLEHIAKIEPYSTNDCMSLDRITQRNLELTESIKDGSKSNTLLEVLDYTQTPMGGRMLKQWIKRPLISIEEIQKRQESIEALYQDSSTSFKLAESLDQIRDLERLMSRICSNYATPRDIATLGYSLEQIPYILESLKNNKEALLEEKCSELNYFSHITSLIKTSINENPPNKVSDGNIICTGYNQELDELRSIGKDSKAWLAKYQADLKESTGIKSLKIGYTRVFGYYIDVSKAQADKVPEYFQRRQTLVNNERFISPELKDYESKALTAEERISALESSLFQNIREEISQSSQEVFNLAQAIAQIDCINSLSVVAREKNYIKPKIDGSNQLKIKDGRHPVIEAALLEEGFIPNDTLLDDNNNKLLIITGPNMAGKSTYIRQVALITIMAQIGSYIPASQAHIGIVDKVFTRIGANDDLSRGQSTFMVEMTETANIINNCTDKSLVILDEIGRGTSTYDGISLAWAVAENLLTAPSRQPKTLFATHYWEITEMEKKIPGAKNYNVAIEEHQDEIIFMRKIIAGSTDRSYGIHVAKLAGIPNEILKRAEEVLHGLENDSEADPNDLPHHNDIVKIPAVEIKGKNKEIQLLLFDLDEKKDPKKNSDHILKELQKIDIVNTTPMQALQKLATLKEKVEKLL